MASVDRSSSLAKLSARKLADPLTEAESEFVGKVLSFVPVMARSSKLMRPFLDESDRSLHELAARTLHQAKVMTIRTVWKDLVEPLKAGGGENGLAAATGGGREVQAAPCGFARAVPRCQC